VLDSFNKRVVEMMRDRDFNQSIEEMPGEQLDALIKVYRERPLRDERDFENNIRVGYLMLVRGQVDDAVKEFERAIEIDPSATNSLLRGLVIPELETHFEEHRGTVEGRYRLGRAYATVKSGARRRRSSSRTATARRRTPSRAPTWAGCCCRRCSLRPRSGRCAGRWSWTKPPLTPATTWASSARSAGAATRPSPTSTAPWSSSPTTRRSTTTWGWGI
jgi:hypothetical protein